MKTFRQWATHAPMGWNSWDCFGASVTEAEVKANADYVEARLKPFGYEYIVVDIQWYEPHANSWEYHQFTDLQMDDECRLIPAASRFPSAADGAGFAPLAEYVHRLGLKFGIHLMRGIPRQAVHQNRTFADGRYSARDVAANNICPWNSDMYGLDMTKPGAQVYYDQLMALYASWGVDFLKVDDICDSRLYGMMQPEIQAIRQAIDKSGRPMVLSLSPGPADINQGAFLQQNANMWRLTDDFWDTWDQLKGMFPVVAKWAPFVREGDWPDPDMLPIGAIRQRAREKDPTQPPSRFTRAEAQTMLTLWSLLRAPLFLGGDLTHGGHEEGLYTNSALLKMRRTLTDAWQETADENTVVWRGVSSDQQYLAVFNLADAPAVLDETDYALPKSAEPVWPHGHHSSKTIPAHGVGLWVIEKAQGEDKSNF